MCVESTYYFETLFNFDSRRGNEGGKKVISEENRLGLSNKCTSCCYDTIFDKI